MIPYGQIRPTIKPEIKQELLPCWDGSPSTAVDYFLKIQQLAALEGDLPEALGYWLWMNLEDGSDIKNWFATLTYLEQAHMHSHYINYLRGIKEGYLGEAWQSKINRVYEGQYFRQMGHEKELLKTFIIRRIMYTRMLTSAKPGGTLEISLIMWKAPMSWKTILVMPSIKSTTALYTKVVDYEDDLLEAWRRKSTTSSAITVDNLIPTLRRLGWEQPRSRMSPVSSCAIQERLPQDRRVLMTVEWADLPRTLWRHGEVMSCCLYLLLPCSMDDQSTPHVPPWGKHPIPYSICPPPLWRHPRLLATTLAPIPFSSSSCTPSLSSSS